MRLEVAYSSDGAYKAGADVDERDSLEPLGKRDAARRARLSLRDEFELALLPSATVLVVFAFVEVLSHQRLLFASLASSAFLIYLDPEHVANSARTLLIAQLGAACLGFGSFELFGAGYLSGGVAMMVLITLMILLDAMHPPAVSTALAFGFRPADDSNLLVFGFAVGVMVILLGLQRVTLWRLLHVTKRNEVKRGGA